MSENPKGWPYFFLLPLAIAGMALAETSTGWLQLAALAIGGTCALVCFVGGGNWIVYQLEERVRQAREIAGMTPTSILAHELHGLIEPAVEVVHLAQKAQADVMATAEGLQYFIRGTDITFDFLEEFLENSNGMYLCPVRRWSEGTIGRVQARELTDYFKHLGWAIEGTGNNPARWVGGMNSWKVREVFFPGKKMGWPEGGYREEAPYPPPLKSQPEPEKP